MSDCTVQSYDARQAHAEGKKYSWSDRVILWRSDPLVHTEWQFSERYGCISVSATLRDGCKCVRFKLIDYTKHPKRWKGIVVPMTDQEENGAWRKACDMADLPYDFIWPYKFIANHDIGELFYGRNAIKYDIIGMLCHISKWNLWKPTKGKTWCSKAVNELILCKNWFVHQWRFEQNRDEIMPVELDRICKNSFPEAA